MLTYIPAEHICKALDVVIVTGDELRSREEEPLGTQITRYPQTKWENRLDEWVSQFAS